MSDDLNRSSMPASGDRERHHMGGFLENGIKSLPHEFGLFDADGRLLVASKGLADRCESDVDRLIGTTFDETLQLFVPGIASVDGIGAKDSPHKAFSIGLWRPKRRQSRLNSTMMNGAL
jgi:hypothetical protein